MKELRRDFLDFELAVGAVPCQSWCGSIKYKEVRAIIVRVSLWTEIEISLVLFS